MGVLLTVGIISLLLGLGFMFLSVRDSLMPTNSKENDDDKFFAKYLTNVLGKWFVSIVFFLVAAGCGVAILIDVVKSFL